MRKNLTVEELGDLLDRPFNAILATYRRDGGVLLSPVWHEWADGGFTVVTSPRDVKMRHIERERRAAIVVADHEPPFRGIEVSGTPTVDHNVLVAQAAMQRIASRYLGEQRGRDYADSLGEDVALIRLAPGALRTWDFADDAALA
ncbi:MAG: pyridoxamine 5'-phosphate oxidase family protein [Chloroflexi bacterium]|nr:pyridoxamine 5'-phosphate oxidase family protein [Chloroflexota bacterium]MBV9545700.1 pyridoxamine 5'-phosphate oxidase family protein [Chloroflexota bacterium]